MFVLKLSYLGVYIALCYPTHEVLTRSIGLGVECGAVEG